MKLHTLKRWTGLLIGCTALIFTTHVHAARKVPTSTICKGKKWNKARFSHRLYSSLLKKHVRRGRVHYNGLKKQRKKLDMYLCRLAHTNSRKIRSRKARFAFWINAYNAITLRAVLDRLPASRAAQKRFSPARKKWNFWRGHAYQVSGKWRTLDQIENKWIRPRFRDARLHFALVCAASGCPYLLSKSYTGSRLNRMLNRNTRRYLRSKNGAKLNRSKKTLHLSKLFKWYKSDFEQKPHKHFVLFAAKYLKKKDRAFVRKHYKTLKIKWIPYSWKLNVQ